MENKFYSVDYTVKASKVSFWENDIHYKAFVEPANKYEKRKIYVEFDYFYKNLEDTLQGKSDSYQVKLYKHVVKTIEAYVNQALSEGYTYKRLS